MDAKTAIIEACQQLQGKHDYVAIWRIADQAAALMGSTRKRKQHLRQIREVFETAFDSYPPSLPFTFATHLHRRQSRKQWDNGQRMDQGVTIRGKNYKCVAYRSKIVL